VAGLGLALLNVSLNSLSTKEKGRRANVQPIYMLISKATDTPCPQTGEHIALGSVHMLAKSLNSHSNRSSTTTVTYKVTAMQELLPSDWKARSCYYRCFQELAGNRFLDLELVSFLDKA
jgi:hypothetical protein